MSSMSESEEYDDIVLSQFAAKMGGIQPMLKSMFGFLHRRTDFYVEYDPVKSPKAHMGFPKGVASRIVQDAFLTHSFKSYEKMQEVSDPSNYNLSKKMVEGKEAIVPDKPRQIVSSLLQTTEDGKQVPIGNGGIGPNYYWTQTLIDLTVYIDAPEGTRGKDVSCEIKAREMSLSVTKGQQLIVQGTFEDLIRTDESMWTINISSTGTQAPQIVVTLDKTRKTWWKHVFLGHPEIDTSKVDSTQKISEYDDTTQASIRKIMAEQQAQRGL